MVNVVAVKLVDLFEPLHLERLIYERQSYFLLGDLPCASFIILRDNVVDGRDPGDMLRYMRTSL